MMLNADTNKAIHLSAKRWIKERCYMSDVLREWIEKATGDFRTATRELAAVSDPNYDAVCFHSQQCIEKLLKAALIKANVRPPKTHDLAELGRRLNEVNPAWHAEERDLIWLTKGAAEFRYPGDAADREKLNSASSSAQSYVTF